MEEPSLNVGYSYVLYFVLSLFSLKQMPAREVCGSGSGRPNKYEDRFLLHQVVWQKPSDILEEPVASIIRVFWNENGGSEFLQKVN
jgi:hypothetical protein